MTEYLKGRFSVPLMGSQQYRDNWDAIFKKQPTVEERRERLRELTQLSQEYGGYDAEVVELPTADIPESPRSGTSEESTPTDTPLPPGHVRLPGGGIRKPRNNK